jgi:hypothetical protein
VCALPDILRTLNYSCAVLGVERFMPRTGTSSKMEAWKPRSAVGVIFVGTATHKESHSGPDI